MGRKNELKNERILNKLKEFSAVLNALVGANEVITETGTISNLIITQQCTAVV